MPRKPRIGGQAAWRFLRFDGGHHRGGAEIGRDAGGIRHHAHTPGKGGHCRRMGFNHHSVSKALFQPAGQHRAAHLAAANKKDRGEFFAHAPRLPLK